MIYVSISSLEAIELCDDSAGKSERSNLSAFVLQVTSVKFVSRDDFVLTGSTDKVSECFRFVPLSVSSDIEQSGVEPCVR